MAFIEKTFKSKKDGDGNVTYEKWEHLDAEEQKTFEKEFKEKIGEEPTEEKFKEALNWVRGIEGPEAEKTHGRYFLIWFRYECE